MDEEPLAARVRARTTSYLVKDRRGTCCLQVTAGIARSRAVGCRRQSASPEVRCLDVQTFIDEAVIATYLFTGSGPLKSSAADSI